MVTLKKSLTIFCALIAVCIFSGCGNDKSGIADSKYYQNSPLNNYAPSGSSIKSYFVENKLKNAVESKDINNFISLYGDSSLREKFYTVNFIEILNNVNNIKFEVLGSEVAKQPGENEDGLNQNSRALIYYKISGYNGSDYEEFFKRGVLDVALKTYYIENESRNDIKITGDYAQQYYHLKGKITDTEGQNISNAQVSIKTSKYEYSATSYSNGVFFIDFINEPAVTVKVEKSGYASFESEKINLAAGGILEIGNIRLKRDEKYMATKYLNIDKSETSETGFFYENKILNLNELLFATAYDRRVVIDFEKIIKEYVDSGSDFIAVLYKKEKDAEVYEKIGEAFKINSFEDKDVVNGKCYFYKVEIKLPKNNQQNLKGIEKIVAGPVMAIPSSFSLRMEFEKMLAAGLKFKGEKPTAVSNLNYSNSAYLTFDPELTEGISFLTPVKVKSGNYKVFLCAKKLDKNVSLNIKIKQFGDVDGSYFMNKTIDLKSISGHDERELIELGDILIEPKDWRNEVITEDFDDILIYVEKISAMENTEKDSDETGRKICLDMMEFIKKD